MNIVQACKMKQRTSIKSSKHIKMNEPNKNALNKCKHSFSLNYIQSKQNKQKIQK